MSWHSLRFYEPQLPPQCDPSSDFLFRFSSTFHTCIPTDLAFVSSLLGTLSIVSWLFAQLPQIYKNYAIKSTSGLSIYFLVEWCLGDLTNLLGAVFTKQATWQVIVAGYYCFVDLILVMQWAWYEQLQHGRPLRLWSVKKQDAFGRGDGGIQQVVPAVGTSSTAAQQNDTRAPRNGQTQAQDINSQQRRQGAPVWRMPNFLPTGGADDDEKDGRSPRSTSSHCRAIHRAQPSSSIPSPSPRTMLYIACLIALAQASPLHPIQTTDTSITADYTPTLTAGTVLSWLSTALYLISRLPQLYKNYKRRSTAGLSPHLFLAAFFGNLFYSTSILTNPYAWYDFLPHGGCGWAGPDGSQQNKWVLRALPFWLGAAGVLVLDGAVGVQFLFYGETVKVVVLEGGESGRGRKRWFSVSGWMRGWVPSFIEEEGKQKGRESEPLLVGDRGEEYGATNDMA